MAPNTEKSSVERRKSARATNNRKLIGSDSSLISLSLFLDKQLGLFSNTKEVIRQKEKKITVKKKSFVKSTAPRTKLCHSTPLVKNSSDAVPNISTIRKNAFNEITSKKLRSSRNRAPFDPKKRTTISTNRYTLGSTKVAENLFLNRISSESTKKTIFDAKESKLYEKFRRTFMPEAMNSEHNSPKSPPQTAIIHNIVNMHHLDNEEENQELNLNGSQTEMRFAHPATKKTIFDAKESKLYEKFRRTFLPEAMNSENNSPKSPPQTAIIHNIVDTSANMHRLDNEEENQELNLSGPQREMDSDVDSSDLPELSINHNTSNRRLSSHYLNSNKFCFPNKNGVEMFQWASEKCDLKPIGDKIRLNEVLSNSVLKSGFIEFDIGGKKNATIPKLHNIRFLVIRGCAEVEVHTSMTCMKVFLRGQAFYVPKGVIYAITNIGEEKLLVEYVKILAKN